MNVLVTGASGFVGREFCRRLKHADLFVRAALRNDTPLPDADERVIVGDLNGGTDWSKALPGIDTVVHVAGRVHVLEDSAADPLAEFRRVNVEATERLANSAAATGVKRLVFVSSVKVNGERTAGPAGFSEDDAPRPEDPYGISKWEAEQALIRIGAATGLEIVRVRPPLVYGPGVRANFHSLMRWVARGLPLPLGAVSNRRSLVYVKNLTDALLHCVAASGAAGRLFLVSDGEDLSTPELIRRLGRALDAPARLIPVPPLALRLAGGLLGRQAMVCRLTESLTVETACIRNALNWRPPYAVDQAFAETAEWYLRQGRQ